MTSVVSNSKRMQSPPIFRTAKQPTPVAMSYLIR